MAANMKFVEISMTPMMIHVKACNGSRDVGTPKNCRSLNSAITYAEKLMARGEMKDCRVFLNGGDVTHLMGDGWKAYV